VPQTTAPPRARKGILRIGKESEEEEEEEGSEKIRRNIRRR